MYGIPKYAKYLKDVVTNKKNLGDIMIMACTVESNFMLVRKIPKNPKELRGLTLTIWICKSDIVKELCHLGKNPNFIPFSMIKTLGLRAKALFCCDEDFR